MFFPGIYHYCVLITAKNAAVNNETFFLINRPEGYDRNLVHAIESVIIEWTHQIRDVLKKDSSQPILDGIDPTPAIEIEFWKAKALNLECIYDQVN